MISILVLAPIVIAAIWVLDQEGIHFAFCLLLFGALFEWAAVARIETQFARLLYAILGAGTALILPLAGLGITEMLIFYALIASVLGIFFVLFFKQLKGILANRLLILLLGYVIGFGAALSIRSIADSFEAILSLLLVVALTDSAAYLVGNFFGKHRIRFEVSPTKTWEGTIGGIVVGLACLALFDSVLAWLPIQSFFLWPVLIVFIIFGDLFESAMKRTANIKDSGTFLPGHGGFMDRIDSLLAVAPCAYYCLG